MKDKFKTYDKVFCKKTIKLNNKILLEKGIYTISAIIPNNFGSALRLKELENKNVFNFFGDSYFIANREYRKMKLNKINDKYNK